MTDYYVLPLTASNPYDPSTGTLADPFQSYWKPQRVMKPGDTLHLLPGNSSLQLYIGISGTAAAPIRFVGSDPANRPRLTVPKGNAVQLMKGVSYVEIFGLNISAPFATGNGIMTEGTNHHITIKNNVIHNCGGCGMALIHADYLHIEGNFVYDNAFLDPSQASGISLYQLTNSDLLPGYHNVIARNIVRGNMNKVLPPGGTSTTDGNGIIIDDAQHTQHGYDALFPAYTSATRIENNITYANGGRGIHVYYSNNVDIVNNTTYWNEADPYFTGRSMGEIEAIHAENVYIYNNIFYARGAGYSGVQIQDSSNIELDYNLIFGGTLNYLRRSSVSWGLHNVMAYPEFVSPMIDFRLKPGSPAIGAGFKPMAPSINYDGVLTPAFPNIGAF